MTLSLLSIFLLFGPLVVCTKEISDYQIVFLSPSSDSKVVPGSSLSIQYDCTGAFPEIYLSIFRGWENTTNVFTQIIPNTGSYLWQVPEDVDIGKYTIYLETAASGSRTTKTWIYQSFEIVKPPLKIEWITPFRNQKVPSGEDFTLEWTTTGAFPEVSLSFFSGWEKAHYIINEIIPNTGRTSVRIPKDLPKNLQYHFYLETAANGKRTTNTWSYQQVQVV